MILILFPVLVHTNVGYDSVAVAGKGDTLPRKLGIRNLELDCLERCVSGSGPSAPVSVH